MLKRIDWSPLRRLEDWWAVWLGGGIILVALLRLVTSVPRLAKWTVSPLAAFPAGTVPALLALGLGLACLTGLPVWAMGRDVRAYLKGFVGVFALAVLSYALGNQQTLNHYGFNDVIWALALGMAISNTVGRPEWLKPGLRGELFIKTGLVLLGAEILFNRMLALGLPGLGVAWLVTPIVFTFMYVFGTEVLRIPSRSLVATVSAATSVCGVSAAIATGAATRAKREEISYAVSLSLVFTAVMMVGMPVVCGWLGLSQAVSGAWIGGTVDSTGAVVASGALVGPQAMQVATVVKLIQNMLIGLLAFIIATVWVTKVERPPGEARPSLAEVWHRFPKFILGFVGASLLFSTVLVPALGAKPVDAVLKVTGGLRGWLFCLAFASIGLESNFSELRRAAQGGRPVILYIVGQTFNLALTLVAAWIFFGGRAA